ncbi:ankyrin repeat family protein / regulator of chromosome condensation (RCC1) family protein [Klebsormidium nitens]|uniref:Ankyrin repeat family protein / regulator of chromosome condensation (RCC1) family protein n=1 Tax=Klebsormidium nitens TaxID=105231 RepID=A0A0U9HJJ7_KLENI|nr:ankyrin repeat family protein / regulator of chromosome condensation (RCC1) family protein [Klebsormidium nitens]|eukprot:GAQ82051.1 ankyrin repeat family protein / regulator of chromosome condensation (RCC1) family protein [Klebsormidium nitens]
MVQDLWTAARSGTVSDVRSALTGVVRGSGSNGIDARNVFGVNALHLAVWHNHLPIVRALLEAGADPDARDGESGWSSLHRALHFGHLAVAAALVDGGASLQLEDSKKRTPLDLISGDVKQTCAGETCTEVYAWGSGTNYQLGTRTAGIQRVPVRLDHLQGLEISTVSAAKFHSAAVTRDGELLTWGFGRGGRLGHPDFHIHSGQVAVITPRQVITGLGGKQVRAVAAAKHHTVIATEGGEVYTWGSNRDGRLGYTSVDSQPTPRRISSFRLRAVAVAASNKHSAVLSKEGEVFTWGCNGEGQLGYGTSNSAANSVPRCVEAMKGKQLVAVSVAKYHTVVLSADGEVFTWGHKLVMPRRVNVARDTRKGGPAPLKFHRAERLHVVAVAAGGVHSTVISQEGLVFYWESSDVQLRCRQLKALAAHHAVSISAGKHRTAVVTSLGTVFAWDGARDQKPEPLRIPNLKQTTQIAVGESHSVAVATLWIPPFPIRTAPQQTVAQLEGAGMQRDGDDSDEEVERPANVAGGEAAEARGSLKELCEREIARAIVEAKNVLQMTELADALEADELKAFCQAMVLRNLDYVLMVTPPGMLAQIRPSVLAELEGLMGCHVAQGGWVPRPLPCATASGNEPILEEEEGGSEKARESRNGSGEKEEKVVMDLGRAVGLGLGRFLQQKDELGAVKRIRALRKKLQQIEALEARRGEGIALDSQQRAKLRSKEDIVAAVEALEEGREPPPPKEAKLSAEEWKVVGFSPERGDENEEMERGKKGKSKAKRGGKAGKSVRGGRAVGEENPLLKKSASETSLGALEAASPPPRMESETTSVLESLDLPKSPVKVSEGFVLPGVPAHTSSAPNLLPPSPLETPRSTLDPSPGGPKTSLNLPPTPNSWSPATPPNPAFPANPKTPKPKKSAKRGGLSMFLSGALEAVAAAPTPPPPSDPPRNRTALPGGACVCLQDPPAARRFERSRISKDSHRQPFPGLDRSV